MLIEQLDECFGFLLDDLVSNDELKVVVGKRGVFKTVASFSTGKSGAKFPYYRCYFKECPTKIRSIPKDTLEQEFADYLAQITPKQKFLKAFKAVILDVWDEQYETINEERKRLTVELDRFEEEKKALIAMKKKELIEDDDFKDEFADVKDRIADQHTKLAKVRMETFNIDEAVDYVFGFVGTLPETWVEADFTQKQQLQSLIFPEKPVYTYSGFETPVLSPIFATKKTHHIDESLLVNHLRVSWNQLLEEMRGWQELRALVAA